MATAITMVDRVILTPMILVMAAAGVAIDSRAQHGVREGRAKSGAILNFTLGKIESQHEYFSNRI